MLQWRDCYSATTSPSADFCFDCASQTVGTTNKIVQIPTEPKPTALHFAQPGALPNATVKPMTVTTIPTANSFTRQRMPRCVSQSRRMWPKYGVPRNHRCNRGDDRAKQAPASSTQGVVGSTGRIAPSIAMPTNSSPRPANRNRRTPVYGIVATEIVSGWGSVIVITVGNRNLVDCSLSREWDDSSEVYQAYLLVRSGTRGGGQHDRRLRLLGSVPNPHPPPNRFARATSECVPR